MADPLTEALSSYIETQPTGQPLSLRNAVQVLRGVYRLAGVSDVTLEQKIIERACQEGMKVEFDIRPAWAA